MKIASNGQVILTELNPMSQAPEIPSNVYVVHCLVFFDYMPWPVEHVYAPYGWNDPLSQAIGWVYLPTYEKGET